LIEGHGAFYAHSLQDRDKQHWQPLAEHLRAVAKAAGARGAKFGASNAVSLAGLLHDLGKYAPAFQRRLDGAGDKVDHSTAGAQEVVQSATSADDGCEGQKSTIGCLTRSSQAAEPLGTSTKLEHRRTHL
jgi:CRISPR-associated endonuclease/helicase Cas3